MSLQVEGSTIGFPSRMVAGLPTEQLPTTPLPPAGGGPGLVVSGGGPPVLLIIVVICLLPHLVHPVFTINDLSLFEHIKA